MARKRYRPTATSEQLLTPLCTHGGACGQPMRIAYRTQRTITTLQGICRLTLHVRRYRNQAFPRYHGVYRPEEEGRWAFPHGECGLDVIALVGSLRSTAQRSVSEMHQALRDRGIQIAERTATHLRGSSPLPEIWDCFTLVLTICLEGEARRRARFPGQCNKSKPSFLGGRAHQPCSMLILLLTAGKGRCTLMVR